MENTNESFEWMLAHDKMLKEMMEEHSETEDAIHNWLCKQDSDTELAYGILKDDRTIKGAVNYCTQKAKEQFSKGGPVAMVADDTVYSWVREYFILDKIDLPKAPAAKVQPPVAQPIVKPKKEKPKTTQTQEDQMDIFDFLGEEVE